MDTLYYSYHTFVQQARGGGGGYSPQILVGICRGKVKNGQGLRNGLSVERENVGLRNELEPFWAWKCGAPELAWAFLSVKMRISGTAANPGGDERVQIKEILKMMVSGTAKSAKKCKMVMLRNGLFLVIYENYMLQNGNSGLKMGVSRAAHTQYAYIWKYPPPPPRGQQDPGRDPGTCRLYLIISVIKNYWLVVGQLLIM